MRKYLKWSGSAILLFVVVATLAVFHIAGNAFADPLGGDSDDSNVGGCGAAGTNCTRWGITWVKQPLNEFLQSAERVGLTEKQKQDMIKACEGMANPYVNRLAYVDFANGGKIQLGSVSGLISNDRADRNNAVYVDPSSIPGGMSAAEAQALFEYAKSIGVDMQYNWNEMAIFAFDEAWKGCGTNQACLSQVMQDKLEAAKPENGGGSSATAFFQSKTIIDVGDGIPEGPQDSGWDSHVAIEFSTDKPSVTVNFSHTIEYNPGGFSLGGDDKFTTKATAGIISSPPAIDDDDDTVNNFTPFSITTGGGGTFGVFTTGGSSQSFPTAGQTVSLSPGETKTVCSYISYSNKFANMKSKKHILVAHEDAVKGTATTPPKPEVPEKSHFDWYLDSYSGSGSSGACATITRPADPTGQPENRNPGAGDPNTKTSAQTMYAGETARLWWDLQAPTYDTRRLMQRQITGHLVDAVAGRSNRFFVGNPRSGSSPHGYYSGSNIIDRHIYDDTAKNHSSDHYSADPDVVVPDQVGHKYCNSGGYRYESWYSINGNWKQDTRGGKNYWYVYGASCRVIAKKPSVAMWNGSLMSSGSVTTSASPRYDNAKFGPYSYDGGPLTLYGSWSEYLAAIGKDITYFGSGASFGVGSKDLSTPKSSPFDSSNSSLTIANKDHLGTSGIYNNSTYRTRLATFLENGASTLVNEELGGLYNVNNTQVWRRDGNLRLVGDITVKSDQNYQNIFQVPQVVIFVHGNLEISSNVSRIDAWLVVDGTVNTCADFVPQQTEADALNRQSNTCSQQLVFNGPVLANRVILKRSFGSDPVVPRRGTFNTPPAKYNPGEVFNLRTDTYLWARAQASRYGSSYTESYSRELAPRY